MDPNLRAKGSLLLPNHVVWKALLFWVPLLVGDTQTAGRYVAFTAPVAPAECERFGKKVFPCGNSFLVETPLRELPHISGVVGS